MSVWSYAFTQVQVYMETEYGRLSKAILKINTPQKVEYYCL